MTRLLLAFIALQAVACSAGIVDKARHENLYRAAKNMEGAISVGVNLLRYRELLQQFATEMSIAKDKASNQAERDMVAAFDNAFLAYRDAGTLWEKKMGGSEQLSPSGDAELMRITDAYPISGTGSGAISNSRSTTRCNPCGAQRVRGSRTDFIFTTGRLLTCLCRQDDEGGSVLGTPCRPPSSSRVTPKPMETGG